MRDFFPFLYERTNIPVYVSRKACTYEYVDDWVKSELRTYKGRQSAVTVACHVIPASGRLVDVDIPELSESPWPVLDIFWTSMGRRIVKELDLKLTLRIMGRGSAVQISARPKVTIAQTSRLFIGIVYIAAVVSQYYKLPTKNKVVNTPHRSPPLPFSRNIFLQT